MSFASHLRLVVPKRNCQRIMGPLGDGNKSWTQGRKSVPKTLVGSIYIYIFYELRCITIMGILKKGMGTCIDTYV